jgi:Holliday junction resolvase RusA-like endonuclease
MKINLYLNSVKPINLNNCQKITTIGRHARKYKTKEYNQLESKVNSILNSQKSEIRKFNKYYNEEKHYIDISYRFYYPILTKKMLISKRSQDVDNIVKPINDIIFKHLLADDSQIINLNATKIHSAEPRIVVEINIRRLSSIL